VKLGPDGEIVRLLIGDFDTAKKMKELHNRTSTTGTPGYIPPEIWSIGKGESVGYTFAADIYSFGVIIFETLSFRRPFEELNRGLQIQEQLADSKKTYQDLVKGFSKAQLDAYHPLLLLFSQCCALDPSERPTVSFLIMSLKNIIVQAGGSTSAGLSSPPTRERAYSSFK